MHTLSKDLTIDLGSDQPGTLGKAFDAIAKAGVNIDGYAEIGGTLHVLAADSNATRRAVESAGFRITREDDVVVVNVPDRPGVAAGIFRQLGDANVNVGFSYVATGNRVVVGAANITKAAESVARQAALVRRRARVAARPRVGSPHPPLRIRCSALSPPENGGDGGNGITRRNEGTETNREEVRRVGLRSRPTSLRAWR